MDNAFIFFLQLGLYFLVLFNILLMLKSMFIDFFQKEKITFSSLHVTNFTDKHPSVQLVSNLSTVSK